MVKVVVQGVRLLRKASALERNEIRCVPQNASCENSH